MGIFGEGRRVFSRAKTVTEPTSRLIRPGLSGFKQFLMRGNVVDLAIAVVIGTAFTAVVNSLVKNLFTPLIAAIGGKPNFADLTFKIHRSTFRYGAFINDVISFLVVAAAIYFLIVLPIAKANEMRHRGDADEEKAPALSDEAQLLTEIRDLLAARGDDR